MTKKRSKKSVTEYMESGVLVRLPHKQHFRFQNLRTYQKLSGKGLKEMDFCWLESLAGKDETLFFLMEIWSKPTASNIIEELTGKIIDSLLMLASLWLPQVDLHKDVPGEFHRPPYSIEVFVVITGASEHIGPLKDQLNTHLLKSQLSLFNIKEVMVLDNNDRSVIKSLGLDAYLPE